MVNDQAQTLLGLHADAVGRTVFELLPPGHLRDVLQGVQPTLDEVVITDDYSLVVNRMPVILAGRPHGSVVTLRDRTELAAVLSELHGERGLTDSLRAQQHEFANRMHAVAGLLELGHPQEALSYLTEIRGIAAELDDTLRTHVGAPQIVGLLLGKAAEASERGIRLEISPATWLSESPGKVQVLITVVGNLVDNAMEALAKQPPPRHVVVEIVEDDDQIAVRGERQRARRARRPDSPNLLGRLHHQGWGVRTSWGPGAGTRRPAGRSSGRCRRGVGRPRRHRSRLQGDSPQERPGTLIAVVPGEVSR